MSETHKTVTLQEWRDTYRPAGWKLNAIRDGMCVIQTDARTKWDQTPMSDKDRENLYRSQVEAGDKSFISKGREPETWDQHEEELIGGDPRRNESIGDTSVQHKNIFSKRAADHEG